MSVIVFVRAPVPTIDASLRSLAAQHRFADIEVILSDGTPDGEHISLKDTFPWLIYLSVPNANMPQLKGEAVAVARGKYIAILDPTDAADPEWISEIIAGFAEDCADGIGGSVLLADVDTAANAAAYLFEYGAFNPPLQAGITSGDLPGNNVAYRREVLIDKCADILQAEGFNKPFCHARLRETGGSLVIRPGMRVRHLTAHHFWPFAVRRFHYGRCFGAKRWHFSTPWRRLLFAVFGPAVPLLLIVRHVVRAARHRSNRRTLARAGPALAGICAFWGTGEWLGYWFGAGRSCERLY